MKHKRIILSIIAALLFMSIAFRPGCRIVLNGRAMPGVYEPAAVTRCTAAAERTAEEITRRSEAAPFTVVPVLCLERDEVDETLLYHVLLESYEGVEKLYALSVDGKRVGLTNDLRNVYRLRQAYPKLDIRFAETYTYAGAESDMGEVRQALQILEDSMAGPF